MMNKKKQFIKVIDASKFLGYSKATLYRYNSRGVLPHYKMQGRRVYFKVDDLDEFVFDKNNRVSSQKEIERKAADWILKNK